MNYWLVASVIVNVLLAIACWLLWESASYSHDQETTWHQKYNVEFEKRLDAERAYSRAKEIFLPHKDK